MDLDGPAGGGAAEVEPGDAHGLVVDKGKVHYHFGEYDSLMRVWVHEFWEASSQPALGERQGPFGDMNLAEAL